MSTEPPTSFYRRPLPPHLVDLQSDEGKARFTSALCNNEADPFFPLVSNYQTQSHPAFCGLTTLSTVLNALQIDPKRVWSHPWRWFAESLLQCCLNMDNVKKVGVNIEQLATIASCQGATVHTFRHFDLEHTRQLIRKCMKHPSDQGFEFIVASYDRATLGQTGAGHFSPIAAYDSKSDSALVLDVARFKVRKVSPSPKEKT